MWDFLLIENFGNKFRSIFNIIMKKSKDSMWSFKTLSKVSMYAEIFSVGEPQPETLGLPG